MSGFKMMIIRRKTYVLRKEWRNEQTNSCNYRKTKCRKIYIFNYVVGKRISIVEDTPGVTRDRVYADANWRGRNFTLVDTGGIEPESDDVILSQMRRQADMAVEIADVILFITDIKQGVTAADHDIALMLKKSKKPIILVCNKSDTFGKLLMNYMNSII